MGGSAGLVYTPNSINANVNDVVMFNFMAKNHTVTQSNFALPCVKAGMDSGFMPNDGSMNPPPSLTIQVTSMSPTWFYCRQKEGTHCGMGMTFSINPTADKTQAMFQAMAMQQNGTGSSSYMSQGAYASGSAPAAPASSGSPYVMGSGTYSGGQCQCQCQCGAGTWPPGNGMGAYGGYGG